MALSLYRKYRPEVFSDVVGQEHVEKTLINALSEGAVSHAYLFCGPRGTGKTTTARLLAKALLCEAGQSAQPDGTCPQCLEIAQGTHPDVFELDAASRTGVDNVREEIIGRVNFAPTRGRYKVYIIDEVHMLSTAAFNALLKTLEEPPEHVIFVLCTTDPHKVPETIQSRCQRFDFRRFSIDEITSYLERICAGEGFTFEPEALEFIAAKSAGGMRDATTSLEQVGVYTAGNITLNEATRMFGQIDAAALFELGHHIAAGDTAACFLWVDDLVGKGVDLSQFAHDLSQHMRNLYVVSLTGGQDGIVACTANQLAQYAKQAQEFGGPDRLARALSVCGALEAELRYSTDARLSVEVTMTRLTRPQSDLTLEALAERLEALEAGGFHAAPAAQMASKQPSEVPFEVEEQAEPSFDPATYDEPAATHNTAEEAPQVEAVSQVTQEMSPERIRLAVITAIKAEDASVAALLDGASLAVENGQYHILFPSGADFQMRIVNSSDNHALIGRAFESVLGQTVPFDCRIGAFEGLSSDEAPKQEPPVQDFPVDDGYYDDRAGAEEPFAVADEATAHIADALSAFGEGVKIKEVDDEH